MEADLKPLLQPSSTLADLAVAFPAASRVFRRHGLDYCCHGRLRIELPLPLQMAH